MSSKNRLINFHLTTCSMLCLMHIMSHVALASRSQLNPLKKKKDKLCYSQGTSCKWQIVYSRNRDDDDKTVFIKSMKLTHNHELNSTTFDMAQRRSGKATKLAVNSSVIMLVPYIRSKQKVPCSIIQSMLMSIVAGSITLNSWAIYNIMR